MTLGSVNNVLIFHLVIHEIQVVKLTNYTFGFGCEDVYNLDIFLLKMSSRIRQIIT